VRDFDVQLKGCCSEPESLMENRQEFRMPSVSKIGIATALLLVVAVAVVQFTPDPTDDINALLHRGKAVSVRAFDAAFGLNLELVVRPWADFLSVSASIMPLLERLCTYRC
jgi:hypothetical protein